VHESGIGPKRRFWNVRCGAGLGGQADVARINGKEKQRAHRNTEHDADGAPKGAVSRSEAPNWTFTPTRQVNVTAPRASNLAAVLASFLQTCASAASRRAREAIDAALGGIY
jgi:hypothetical protein